MQGKSTQLLDTERCWTVVQKTWKISLYKAGKTSNNFRVVQDLIISRILKRNKEKKRRGNGKLFGCMSYIEVDIDMMI